MPAVAPAQCRVCRERAAEYTCPRCNARYCSVDCYKQHSDHCTEGFYRDAAVTELHAIRAGEDERRHMLDILQRLHQEEVEGGGDGSSDDEGGGSEAEDDGGLSEETLHRLLAKMAAPGGALDIGAEDLSPAELAAFHRALAAGELSGAVQPWDPWWLSEDAARLELSAAGTTLVAAVDAEQQQQQQAAGGSDSKAEQQAAPHAPSAASGGLPPPPSRPLPPLAALTRAAPSPLLSFQLLELLYAYCHTLRLFNGDYSWEAADAADALFALSQVLAAAAAPAPPPGSHAGSGSSGGGSDASAVAPALLACVQRACQPPVGSRESRAFAVGVLSDVAAVLRLGRPVVLTALMDTSRLVEAARQQLEGGSSSDTGGSGGSGGSGAAQAASKAKQQRELRRRLVAAERKLLFFLSWANEQPPEAYDMLALAVAAEHEKHLPLLAVLSLALVALPEAVARALPRMHKQLRSLELRVKHLPASAAALLEGALPQLPRLKALRCSALALPPTLLDAIANLTKLTLLSLGTGSSLSEPPAGAAELPSALVLTRLQRLRHLELATTGGGQALSCPPPAAFPSLQTYSYHSHASGVGVGTLRIAGCGNCASGTWPDGPGGHIKVALRGECSLAQLLQMLAPPNTPPVSSLTLSGTARHDAPEHVPAALHGCTQLRGCTSLKLQGLGSVSFDGAQLPALHVLSLGSCGSVSFDGAQLPALRVLSSEWLWDAKLDAALRALQQASPQLCELDLGYGGDLSGLPSLLAMTGLCKLSFSSRNLASLPEGPWLQGLEELDISWGCSRLPRLLGAATQLRRLALGSGCWISHADVDHVLRHLQCLTELQLHSWAACMTPDVIAHLLRSLPALRPPAKW